MREAYVDGVFYKEGFDDDVGIQKVLDGEYDLAGDVSPQGPALERVVSDPELRQRYLHEPTLCTRYIF